MFTNKPSAVLKRPVFTPPEQIPAKIFALVLPVCNSRKYDVPISAHHQKALHILKQSSYRCWLF